MNRTKLILLGAAIAVVAFGLGAGIVVWMTRSDSEATPDDSAALSVPPGEAPASKTSGGTEPADEPPAAEPSSTGVFINGRPVSQEQLQQLQAMYGAAPPPGRYWYDTQSGLYGIWGREAGGYIRPGHDFGPLPANASQGTTGVFINGRQINLVEAAYLQRIFGAVYQGRWWLDGTTGNIGVEGNPTPVANIFLALRQSQSRGQGDGYRYRDSISGSYGGAEGGCVWMSVPGSGSAMSSGCD
jgi:hypothetical protein